MTAALTPELAIAYVREMSADVRAAVVLDAAGALLAGPEALAGPARDLLAATRERDVAVRRAGGLVIAARGAGHAIVVAAGPGALTGPHALDARAAVEALDAPGAVSAAQSQSRPGAGGGLEAAAEAAISATRRAI